MPNLTLGQYLVVMADHTLLLRAISAGQVRVNPRERVLIIGNEVFSLDLDEFDCPMLTPELRELLTRSLTAS